MKVRDLLLLPADGWYQVLMGGSHHVFQHGEKPGMVVVPGKPGDDMPPGTLAAILTQAGLGGTP